MRSRCLLGTILLFLPHTLRSQTTAPAGEQFYASAVSDWKTGPDGVARMNLVGDSTSPTGIRVFRLRYPASLAADSSRAVAHFHMGTEHILVLKGTLVVGFGEKVDYAAAKAYGPGGFVVIMSGRPHYHWTRGETEIQIEAAGPTATVPWPDMQRPPGAGPRPEPPVDSTQVWANGLPQWNVRPNGGATMRLAPSDRPPGSTELVAMRMHFPGRAVGPDAPITYHYHFGTEHITILKGTFWFGIGEKADRSKAKVYGPGSFIENPAGSKHFEWFDGDVDAHIESVGSLGAIPLNPETGQPR